MPGLIEARSGKVTCMAAKRRQKKWHAWALSLEKPKFAGYLDERRAWLATQDDSDLRAISDDWPRVLRGLERAQELATLAERRRNSKLLSGRDPREWIEEDVPTPFERYGSDLPRVIEDVTFARQALFDTVGDRAIRSRLARFARQAESSRRNCTMAGCQNELPPRARSTRRRCDACREEGRRR